MVKGKKLSCAKNDIDLPSVRVKGKPKDKLKSRMKKGKHTNASFEGNGSPEKGNKVLKKRSMKRKHVVPDLPSDEGRSETLNSDNSREKVTKLSVVDGDDLNTNKDASTSRKELTRQKLTAERLKKGLVMLSPKSEAKIYKLKKALHKKGLPEAEIKQIIRQKRRTEELKLRKDEGFDIRSKNDQSVCFRCRKPGHRIADCKLVVEDSDQGVGVCFRCGSTEHILRNCSNKFAKGGLPFAKCFVCDQQGHLSKECPSNPKGAFPQGGKCNFCGSVNHLKKDCPQLDQQNEDEFVVVTVQAGSSADALD